MHFNKVDCKIHDLNLRDFMLAISLQRGINKRDEKFSF